MGDGGSLGPVLKELERDRAQLSRSGISARIADILRSHIADGLFLPGTRLYEEAVSQALGVSRNTLREAFALLLQDRLVVHELNRGVFVRELTVEDVGDLYRVRRLLECGAVASADLSDPNALADVAKAVQSGVAAAARSDWQAVGTASIRFHEAIVGLAGSERLDAYMKQVMAEFRLIYPVLGSEHSLYQAYLDRHREILQELERGNRDDAEKLLRQYLRDSEERLTPQYADSLKSNAARRG